MTATPEEAVVVAGGEPVMPGTAAAPPRQWWRRKGLTSAISTASVLVALAAWQLCASQGVVAEQLPSSPWGVVQAARLLIDNGQLGSDVASSARLFGVGIGLAIAIGAIGGVLIGWWRRVAAVFEPWLAILDSLPLIALRPLILVWFGSSFSAGVVMVV